MTSAKALVKQQLTVDVVDENSVGQRLDNYLLKRLKGVPKSHLYKLMRKGQIRVNSKRVKPHQKLLLEDKVRIPPIRLADSSAAQVPKYWQEELPRRIIYEDDQLLVIDKPTGISVHRGTDVEFGVLDALQAGCEGAQNWALAHRLDRDTSGCLVIAKNRSALLAIQDCFRQGGVKKQYLALTATGWSQGVTTVDVPLSKNVLKGGERVVVSDTMGKSARSHFEVEEQFKQAALVRVTIETGRTHQIRVHAQYKKCPLAGDTRYGDKAFNRLMRSMGLNRLFLHAWQLEFAVDIPISVSTPLPLDLQELLAKLKN